MDSAPRTVPTTAGIISAKRDQAPTTPVVVTLPVIECPVRVSPHALWRPMLEPPTARAKQVRHVTVFVDRAEVTRLLTLPIEHAGPYNVVVQGVTDSADADSVRAACNFR